MRKTLLGIFVILCAVPGRAQPPQPEGTAKPDNYYAAGNRVEITRPMDGDVVVAGREIHITRNVAGDVLAAGWHVQLAAPADDDVRMAGGQVVLNAPVRGDITVAGGDVLVGEQSHVMGRAWLSGGTVTVNGTFDRELRIAAQTVVIGAEVRQPLFIVAEKLEFLPTARVRARVTYKSPGHAQIAQGAVINGPVEYQQVARREVDEARHSSFGSTVLFTLHLLVAGLVIIGLLPRSPDGVVATLRARPWWSLLVGFVLLVTVPVAAVMLVASVLALPLGLALFAFYLVALFLAVLTTAFYVGAAETRLLKLQLTSRRERVVWLVAGVVTLAVLRNLPFVGGWVVPVSMLSGLGAMTLLVWTWLQPSTRTQPT